MIKKKTLALLSIVCLSNLWGTPPILAQESTKIAVPATKVAHTAKIKLPSSLLWTEVGSNNKLQVFLDENNLTYDKNTGITSAWTKWAYRGTDPNNVKTIYLYSHYDVRLNSFSNLNQISLSSSGEEISNTPCDDTNWNTAAPATLGEDICTALKKKLLSF